MSDTLRLKVIVANEDLQTLRDSGFKLCVTRDVRYGGQEKAGNVVFSEIPNSKLGPNMFLMWQERYQVYETSSFIGGARVDVGTRVADIQGGQQASFDSNGDCQISGASVPAPSFLVRNEWQNPGRVGVNNYDASSGQYATIFISPSMPMHTTSELTPIKKFSVFWDMRLETGTMIDYTTTDPFPFDLTYNNEITLQYKDAVWSIPRA